MPYQDLIFPDDPTDNQILISVSAAVTTPVTASVLQLPVAIHDSWNYPALAQQTVTHVTSGLAFRTQLKEETAQGLLDALLAGFPDQWVLDWTDPLLAAPGEIAALRTLIADFPNDYVALISVSTDPDVEVWICNTGSGQSTDGMADADGFIELAVEVPGTYDVYCYDPVSTDWGTDALGPYSVVLDDAIDATVNADTVGAEGIPCKP